MTNQGGRPATYSPELLEKAWEYIKGGWKGEDDEPNAIPSIVGLAMHLGVTRQTLHAWAKDAEKEQFSYMLDYLAQNQENILLNGGLLNTLNPTITKLVLSKHGYSDKVEQDVNNKHDISDPMKELMGYVAQKGKRIGDG